MYNTTWTEIDKQLDVFLDDAGEAASAVDTYSQPQRIAAWNWAQRVLALHTPRRRVTGLVIDTNLRSAVLPPDFLAVWRIHDADNCKWMRQMPLPTEGSVRYDDDELAQFWVWGGTLHFEQTFTVDTTDYTLHYFSYWPEVEYRDDGVILMQESIIVPQWAIFPLCHLTAAICLTPGAIQAARLRQWNIRTDSGDPTDNSRALQAREHLWWWDTLLSAMVPTNWMGNGLRRV